MKISKLFHLLYGLLMLLPCFAILVKCCYVAFNKNAYESYSGSEITYTQKTLQTNEVNSFDDLVVGNVYKLSRMDKNDNLSLNEYQEFDGVPLHLDFCFYIYGLDDIAEVYLDDYNFIQFFTENSFQFDFYPVLDGLYTGFISVPFAQNSFITIQLDEFSVFDYAIFKYDLNTLSDYDSLLQHQYIIDFISACPSEYLPLTTYYEETETSTLDNVFYYAVDEVTSNDLFSWASNSFLNAPLTYITNLFNMPSDNAIILLLSYWFNISIIWLVFDVMIYVPLLAHRWLDKGIIE